MSSREKCIERIKNDDFIFDERAMVKYFGRKFTEKIKRNNPEGYCVLRDDPSSMAAGALWND